MNDVIVISGHTLSKDMVFLSVLACTLVTLALTVIYCKSNETGSIYEADMDIEKQFSMHSSTKTADMTHSESLENSHFMRLDFCSSGCAVINADSKEVIAKYNAGSQNCRLLAYLFSCPNQRLTEQEIVQNISPDKPENFYIRKAICNLKLDKKLRSKIFTFESANTVVLNTIIPLDKQVA